MMKIKRVLLDDTCTAYEKEKAETNKYFHSLEGT